MGVVLHASGTQSATVTTEHTLADVAVAGVFQLHVDVSALADGDELELRVKAPVLAGGTLRTIMVLPTLIGAQPSDFLVAISPPIPNDLVQATAMRFTLKQTLGVSRSFPWKVVRTAVEDNLDVAVSTRSTYAGGAVASVTGNVGGNVVGSVGSVTAPVTAGTVSDKAGYSLSAAGVQAIWDALTSALSTAGSVGKSLIDRLDATVSSRLASASYSAPPTAAAIADAVLDEPTSEHLTTGTAGGKLALIGTGSVTVRVPVSGDGGTVTLVRGDDYRATDGRALTWTDAAGDWPDLTGATLAFVVRSISGYVAISDVTCPNPGASQQTIQVAPTATETRQLTGRASLPFDVQATLASGSVITLVQGVVIAVDDVAV